MKETLSTTRPTQPEENQNDVSSHHSIVPADLIPTLHLETEFTENNTISTKPTLADPISQNESSANIVDDKDNIGYYFKRPPQKLTV